MPQSTFSAQSQLHNTVGYSSMDVAKESWTLIGFQFNEVGATDSSVAFDKVLKLGESIAPVTYDEATAEKGAAILVRNEIGTYKPYIYISDADDGSMSYDKTGWADDFEGNLLDGSVKLDAGTGVWLRLSNGIDGDFTVAGEVPSDATATVDFPAGWTLACNPYPIALNPQDAITHATPVTYDEATAELGTAILVRNEIGTYKPYIYISDADDGSMSYDKTGWADDFEGNLLSEPVVPVGTAFWIRSTNAGSIVFSL